MRPRDRRPAPPGRRLVVLRTLAVSAAVGAFVAGCGLPADTEARPVVPSSVPYRLLDREPTSRPGGTEGPAAADAPSVVWLADGDQLVPTSTEASCLDAPQRVVEDLLALLAAAPQDRARDLGRSSALPPSSRLDLVEVVDGVAVVEVDTAATLTADRLPLAVGQVVLSVTSAPGVDAVRVSNAGNVVEVPLPGGALTSRAVTADDYASLLPRRYRSDSASARVGCPD